MFSQVFLAVTHREMERFRPEKTAYMACHFSAGGTGLSNLPMQLPKGSILLLDDSMPVQGHDSKTVSRQLKEITDSFHPSAIILDFQRPRTAEADAMVSVILEDVPCPVAVTPVYAAERRCPVFLPPPPVNQALGTYLQLWLKRGVFLEIAPETVQFTVTKGGCVSQSIPWEHTLPLADKKLHCHFREEVSPGMVTFTLTRTTEDLADLSREAYALGIWGALGLYRELVGDR